MNRLAPLVTLAGLGLLATVVWAGELPEPEPPASTAEELPPPSPAEASPAPPSMEEIAERGFTIRIHKSERRMVLVSPPQGEVVRSWPVGLGFAPEGDKEREGDGRTPEGSFTVVRKLPSSQYYKAFLLSYPTPEDAERGLASGLIDRATSEQIHAAHRRAKTPPQYTPLGGLIEIHGLGAGADWTLGCVAAENDAIDALWPWVRVGQEVTILP